MSEAVQVDLSKAFTESKIYKRLQYARHGIVGVSGTGQWGKTVFVNSLLQEPPFNRRNIVLFGYDPKYVDKNYPDRFRAEEWPEDLEDLPDVLHPSRDAAVLDDAIFRVGARDHATRENRSTQKFATIASHHEMFILLTIQNTSLLDISMMQAQDLYMFHKHMDPVALAFERPMFRNKQLIANVHLAKYRREFPEIHPKAWTYCSTTYEMLSAGLPWYWKPEMSKPYYGRIPK